MKFKFEANIIFDADNIDNALLKLAHHFLSIHNGKESDLIKEGDMKVSPQEEKNISDENFTFFWGGPFSQWHICPFLIEGIQYNCSEQYMMAQKALLFKDEVSHKKIMFSLNPSSQKKYGRKVKNFDVDIWNTYAKDIVYKANYAKFTQNDYLKENLILTAGSVLVEASPYDKIWGIGLSANDPEAKNRSTWQGTNWLGEILTKVREDILKKDR